MKTILIYTGIFTAFQKWSPTTLHNRKHVTWPFMQVDPYYLDAGCVSVLWAVGCGFYRYISMGTTMSMLLLFTRSSRIHRENVDSQTIDIYMRIYRCLINVCSHRYRQGRKNSLLPPCQRRCRKIRRRSDDRALDLVFKGAEKETIMLNLCRLTIRRV